MTEKIKLEMKTSAAVLTLNRPELRNAMDAETIQELRKHFESLSKENDLRVLILRGAGDFFCAGGDLNWMKSSREKSKKENEEDARELGRMIRALDECPFPVITLVQGGAFGGGVGLVAASDIVIAEESAIFSLSEVKLGLIPATIGPLVMRKIGLSEARRLYLTGLRFDAHEAKKIHLIHEVVKNHEELSIKLNSYLKELGTSGPQASREAKKLIRELQGERVWNVDIAEETSKVLSEIRIQPEAQEGLTAFLEKRKPSWASRISLEI